MSSTVTLWETQFFYRHAYRIYNRINIIHSSWRKYININIIFSLSLSLYLYIYFFSFISQIYDIRTIFQLPLILFYFFLNRIRQTFDQTFKYFPYLLRSNKNYHPPSYPSRREPHRKASIFFPRKGQKKKNPKPSLLYLT